MAGFFGRFWGKKTPKQTSRRRRRSLPLAFESLEMRSMLSANIDLNLAAITQQPLEVGQSRQFNLMQAGGTLSVTPADSLVRFQLDPDIGMDTPMGATITSDGTFSWIPAANQIGLHKITVIAISPSSPIGLDAETFNLLVSANTPPTATNLSAPETYTEDTPLNLTDIVITDVTAVLTATLTLYNPAAGSLNTATSGAVNSNYDANTGVWIASGNVADVNSLLAGLTFTPAQDFNGNFTIATSISDGIAAAITGSKAITGTPVNDAPTATNLNASETYTEDTPLNLADIVISDVDSPSVTATLTLSNHAAGSLNTATSGTVTSTYVAGTGVWTASGAIADVNSLLAGLIFTPASNFDGNFTIATSVSDGVAPALTGSKAMTAIAVNDPPNLILPLPFNDQFTMTLGQQIQFTAIVEDPDGAANQRTFLLDLDNSGISPSATQPTITSPGGPFSWTPSQAGTFTIIISVVDDGQPPLADVETLEVTVLENVAPTATNLNAPETYTEDTPLNLIDIAISDVDSPIVTATLTLSNLAAGSLNTATSGTVTSTYVAGTGVWSASGAIADVNTLLAGSTFTPAQDFNSNFSIATSVSDGVAPAITGSKTMTGTAVNDAPTATNLSAAESYTVNTPLNLIDIAISDVDSPNVTATLTLSNLAAGSLNTATSGTVTSSYVAGTGIWSANGAIANVNSLLAGLTFTPATDFNGNFSIATSVSDGVAPAITGSKAITTPFATDDSYNLAIGATLTTTGANGVLANDTSGATNAILVSGPSHGTMTLNPNGTFSYTQTTYGFDQFTYQATNSSGQTDQATVTIQVPGLPPLPAGAVLTTTASGLQFYDFTVGTGASPSATSTVTVDYVGYLPTGTVFDSNNNINFSLADVVAGFSEGVQGMKVGGMRRLMIPPNLGYGSGGYPDAGIGGTDTILFDVTLDAIL